MGEIAFHDYETEYGITVKEVKESDGKDTNSAEIKKTATQLMNVHANFWNKEIEEQIEYNMILGEDNHWRVTEDFELPIQKLLELSDN